MGGGLVEGPAVVTGRAGPMCSSRANEVNTLIFRDSRSWLRAGRPARSAPGMTRMSGLGENPA